MKFDAMSGLGILDSQVDHSLKLLLTDTDPQNGIENSGELNPEAFSERSNLG